MADGQPREGASHWAAGEGAFVIRNGGIIFPGLRLDAGTELTLLKGTLSFAQNSDLTMQPLIDDQTNPNAPEPTANPRPLRMDRRGTGLPPPLLRCPL